MTLSQIPLKLHKHRGGFWRKKLPWTILEEQLPVPRKTAASIIGDGVISLLRQLWCHCNPNNNKLSHTIVVAFFLQIFVYGAVVYAQTWDTEKLYRATLT